MALATGELTITVNANGTASIPGHTVSGPNAVQALMDAYGSRIGKVVDKASGQTTVVNEYREPPRKEVPPEQLKEVPMMYVEYQRNADGSVAKDANGKSIVESFGVKYADGTISYTGSGAEGAQEAARQRQRAVSYNDFVTDARTKEDFASQQEYDNFNTVKNIRLGQGTYNYVSDKDGNTTLYAPGNVVVASGDLDTVRKQWGNEANKLNMAFSSAQKEDTYTPYSIKYFMESQGLASEDDAFSKIYNDYLNRDGALRSIVEGWGRLADQQGISGGSQAVMSADGYISGIFSQFDTLRNTPFEEGLANFKNTFMKQDDPKYASYEDFYSQVILGNKPTTGTPQTIGITDRPTQGTTPTESQTQQVFQPAPQAAAPVTPTPTTMTGGFQQPTLQTPQASTPKIPGFQTPSGVYPTTQETGVISTPLPQTSQLSAVPTSVSTYKNYTGTNMDNLTTSSQSGFGGQRTYRNQFGQTITVTVDGSGNPLTYVPPGYSPAVHAAAKGGYMTNGYADGGMSEDKMLEAKYRIASMNGYNGPKTNQALDAFANASPAMKAKFNAIGVALAKGGYIRKGYAEGGAVSLEDFQGMQQGLISQTMQPIQAPIAMIQPQEADFIGTTAGQTAPLAPFAEAATVQSVAQAPLQQVAPIAQMAPATVTPQVQAVTQGLTPVTGTLGTQSQVQAAQQATTSVSNLQAAQGTAIMMNNPVQREIQAGELISGAANAEKAAAFTEQVQAATATPSQQATVQGQLEGLMQQFEGGATPSWAAGAMRNASAMLAARGLGASSMAGQAVIQAAMEAALPIAQMDAQVQAQFEAQNLSNRQQRAMLAAQQRAEFLGMEFTQEFQARVQNSARIGDIANMNFTAEQNIALENSRAANTVNLQNLSNRQAMVMAEAAALSQLDMQNLNNRQQAAVQNAQNFLQMDMANLSNTQQTALFNAQQNIQALFTDQAAQNAAAQFNASSENQTNQFFASLASNTAQFNAVQQNAMDQFNVNAVNSLRQFNSQIQQQRDMFNAQNGLVVAQANAQWRQNMATLNTAAQNESNMNFAKTVNALTSTNLDAIWQRERDLMSFAFTSSESAMDRSLKLILGDKQLEAIRMELDAQEDAARGALWTRFLFGSGGSGSTGLLGSII